MSSVYQPDGKGTVRACVIRTGHNLHHTSCSSWMVSYSSSGKANPDASGGARHSMLCFAAAATAAAAGRRLCRDACQNVIIMRCLVISSHVLLQLTSPVRTLVLTLLAGVAVDAVSGKIQGCIPERGGTSG